MLRFRSSAHPEKALQKGRKRDPLKHVCANSALIPMASTLSWIWFLSIQTRVALFTKLYTLIKVSTKVYPKSTQTQDEKLLNWRPDALKNLSGEGLKKAIKTRTLFCCLWGLNVLQKGAQKSYFLKVFGVPGPVWAHRALRVDSESHNGAPEIKMGGKIGILELYLEPRIGILQRHDGALL